MSTMKKHVPNKEVEGKKVNRLNNPVVSYWAFMWNNKQNRTLLLASALLSFILFYLLKLAYPMPDMFTDVHSYIFAASKEVEVYYRPYGYSWFLNKLHGFSTSINLVVWMQHLIFTFSSLFLLTSIDYLIGFKNKYIKWAGWILITINPLGLFLANFPSSDSLFTSMTLCWMTTLLWIFMRPKWYWIILSILFLYWAFNIRYTALYYPFILGIIIVLTPRFKVIYKVGAILLAFMVIMGAYKSTKNKVFEYTGADVFAGFDGWQMANNTLYYFKKIDFKVDPAEDKDILVLDTVVRYLIDSFPADKTDGSTIGADFVWDKNSPLKRFMPYYGNKYRLNGYLPTWYHVSEVYGRYAKMVIAENPMAYFRYYILNNARYYFLPYIEAFRDFSITSEPYPETTTSWYRIEQKGPVLNGPDYKHIFMAPYPVFNAVLLIVSLIIPLLFLWTQRKGLFRKDRLDATGPMILWLLYYFANAAFSIIASIVVLRYQAPFIVLAIGFTLVALDKYLTYKQPIIRNDGQ